MKQLEFRNIIIRDYEDDDFDNVINLKIKQGDADELSKMCSMSPRDYFKWHIDYHGDNTKVVILNGDIVGILGVSDGVIYFTTEEVSKGASINFLRAFKKAINYLMKDAKLNKVFTYVDASYTSTIKWAELCGFKIKSEVFINSNTFYYMEYKLT